MRYTAPTVMRYSSTWTCFKEYW